MSKYDDEYIKRQNVIDELHREYDYLTAHGKHYVDATDSMINRIQAEDVVKVVRCNECSVPHNSWTGCPHLNGLIPPPDFYCAYGERGE
jgi:hypothetical protein